MNKELEYKYDIFKEITNICIGNSISALANMANISIDVSPPELYIHCRHKKYRRSFVEDEEFGREGYWNCYEICW